MTSRILYTPRGSARPKTARKIFIPAAIVFFTASLAVGAIYLLRAPSLQMQNIEIEGNSSATEDEIRAHVAQSLAGNYAFILPRKSYFLADAEGIERILTAAFPRIASVEARKEFPDTLEVKIKERSFWGIICGAAGEDQTEPCAYLDQSGFAYDSAPEPSGSLLIKIRSDSENIKVGRQAVSEDTMTLLRLIVERAPAATQSPIMDFELRARVPSEIRATSAGGFTLIFSREINLDQALAALKRVLEKEIGDRRRALDYIDLRFGNKVFYKVR